jgi:hypothetical protein
MDFDVFPGMGRRKGGKRQIGVDNPLAASDPCARSRPSDAVDDRLYNARPKPREFET